jgi:C-terminal processing protease CtpA/Prc
MSCILSSISDRLLAELDAVRRKESRLVNIANENGEKLTGNDDGGGIVGLGLTFHRENPDWSPDGVVIKRLKPRGAAASCGKIAQGDTVLKIDGKCVSRIPPEDLAQMCLGPHGSTTTLTVRKRTTRQEIEVALTRKQRAAVAFLNQEERKFDLLSGELSHETSMLSILHTPPSPQASKQRPVSRRTHGRHERAGTRGPHALWGGDSNASVSSCTSACVRQEGSSSKVGLGLTFRLNKASGEWMISRVKDSGESAAALEGTILTGDVLLEIDGLNLTGKPLDLVCQAMMAPRGTSSQVKIRDSTGQHKTVALTRPGGPEKERSGCQVGGAQGVGLADEASSVSIGSVYEGGGARGGKVGIGLTVKRGRALGGRGVAGGGPKGPVLVSTVKEDGPAAREGSIKRGDHLVSVDGVLLAELDMQAIGSLMMGAPGSACCIDVLPSGDAGRACVVHLVRGAPGSAGEVVKDAPVSRGSAGGAVKAAERQKMPPRQPGSGGGRGKRKDVQGLEPAAGWTRVGYSTPPHQPASVGGSGDTLAGVVWYVFTRVRAGTCVCNFVCAGVCACACVRACQSASPSVCAVLRLGAEPHVCAFTSTHGDMNALHGAVGRTNWRQPSPSPPAPRPRHSLLPCLRLHLNLAPTTSMAHRRRGR